MDKRIFRAERAHDGACAVCGRRHLHMDSCATLVRRSHNDGTDPDKVVPKFLGESSPNMGMDPDKPVPLYLGDAS